MSIDVKTWLAQSPLMAIIRGVKPDEVEAIGEAIFAAGVRIIEVPLNSPDPYASIGKLARAFGDRALIGAGTVLELEQVARVRDVGGRLIVSPNTSPDVIEATVAAGLASVPGYYTPSEAFTAIRAGARALKFFPGEGASPAMLKAQKAVLPKDVPVVVTGGVNPGNIQAWRDAGADGFGLGSGMYKPGDSADQVAEKARAYVEGLGRHG